MTAITVRGLELLGSRIDQDTGSTLTSSLSIVIPVYNESQRIVQTLEDLLAYLDDTGIAGDIITVDDGSTDNTADLVDAKSKQDGRVRIVRLAHGGKARAVLSGLRQATGAFVGFMDADLATPLSTLSPTLSALQIGSDVVIASREGSGSSRLGEPWYRHAMGRVFNGIVRLTLLPSIQDSQCGFKFMTRAARDQILSKVRLYASDEVVDQPRVTAFDVELLYIARVLGLSVKIIPVTWRYGDQSKVNPIRDTLQNLEDVLKVWVNGRRGLYRS